MFFGELPVLEAEGTILAHSRKLQGRKLKKGHVLSQTDIDALAAIGVETITVARPDPDDLSEDDAAAKLAHRLAGAGLTEKPPFTGRCNLFARCDGLLQVNRAQLDRVNLVDEAVTVATLAPDTVVSRGQMVATIKIIPFAVPASTLQQCLACASADDGVLSVAEFRPQRARLIQTEMADTASGMLDKTRLVVQRRLAALGVELVQEDRCEHSVAALSEMISTVARHRPDMILIAGASAIVDRRDIIPQALRQSGGQVEHFGMPVDPGNLLMTGKLNEAQVIGLPGCARSPKYNGLDMVLGRLAADIDVDAQYIMRLGAAGLLKEFASRPQPREQPPASRRSRDTPKITAIVLAAGQSRRMGRDNKLLMQVGGKSMLSTAVEAAVHSRVSQIVVVTGHESDSVRETLADYDIQLVQNPDYKDGLSTSLRHGLSVIDEDSDGVIFCLGDMPKIRAHHIDALIDKFDPVEGRKICVPTVDGKRGNPVLWSTDYIDDILAIGGDTGARHLIGENEEAVIEVPFEDAAAITDVDTPEMYKQIR